MRRTFRKCQRLIKSGGWISLKSFLKLLDSRCFLGGFVTWRPSGIRPEPSRCHQLCFAQPHVLDMDIFFQCGIFLASCIKCVHQANWCCNFETGSLISEHFVFSELGWHQAYHEARPWPSGAAEGQVLCASANTDLACAEINYTQSWVVRYSLGRWYYINIMNSPQSWTSIYIYIDNI